MTVWGVTVLLFIAALSISVKKNKKNKVNTYNIHKQTNMFTHKHACAHKYMHTHTRMDGG